ncbi:MAG: MFS transporter [Mycobacteriales bacterium]
MISRTPADVRRERRAITVVFAVHGAASGSFASRIPWLQDRLTLDEGEIGLALVMGAIGAIVAMPFVGRLIHHRGSAPITRVMLPLFAGVVGLVALSPSLLVLCAAMLAYGATAGTADIGMNAQAVAVEERVRRPIMSGLHGAWSVGGLLGASGGALAAGFDMGARQHLAIVAVILAGVAVLTTRLLTDDPRDAALASPPHFALPSRDIWLIGAVGFFAIFAESSAVDWCAVYLRQVAGAADQTAAAAYATFALTMAIGRIAGDTIVARLGIVRSVRISGAVATLGAAMVVAARNAPLAFGGFALLGLGCAAVVPLAFTAAGRAGPHAGQSIAGVATIAYGAGLAAPAVIGGIAKWTSLPVSFGLVTAFTALIVVGAPALRPGALPVEMDPGVATVTG